MINATKHHHEKWFYGLLVILSFVLYGNTLSNKYSLDDRIIVTENPYVPKGFAGIYDIFDNFYVQTKDLAFDRRPVAVSTFAIEYQFFGANPHISHLINILLYALLMVVLFRALKSVFQLDTIHPALPYLSILLFAVHPLHTEVVASLKNRDEILVLLFGTLFLSYGNDFLSKEQHRLKNAFLSLFFLALGLLSKLNTFIFIGFIILIYFYQKNYKRSIANYLFIFFAIFLAYRALRSIFIGDTRPILFFENPLVLDIGISQEIGTIFNVLAYHIKMLLFPYPLRFYYGYNLFPLISIGNLVPFISLSMHLLFLIFGVYKFLKREIIGLYILCYFGAIALYANFLVPYTGIFSERALFISSIWFVVILLSLLAKPTLIHSKLFKQNLLDTKLAKTTLSIVFIVFSFMTIQRNFYWYDEISLLSHDIKTMENSVLGNYTYANILKDNAQKSKEKNKATIYGNEALKHYLRCIELAPDYPEFYYKVASTYRYNLNNIDSARSYFGYAVYMDSLYRNANFELAKLFFDTQDFRNSYTFFQKTYQLTPEDSLTMYYYAQSAMYVHEMDTARAINNRFIKLYPTIPYPYMNMGLYYTNNLKDDSAVLYFEKAIQLGYRETRLQLQLSNYYGAKGDKIKSDYFKNLQ
jgi:Flp pilus assembly protein TadD